MREKVIFRLLQYRSGLRKLYELGFETVFSYTLAREAGVSPEQVRKDFSRFGLKGNKKGGYPVQVLLSELDKILKRDEERNVILVGLGNIGNALLNYQGFKRNNIRIVAGFDLDPAKCRKRGEITVYPVDELPEVLPGLNAKTAILAIPSSEVQEMANFLVRNGIIGILNFSPQILHLPEHVLVSNVRISNELESLLIRIEERMELET